MLRSFLRLVAPVIRQPEKVVEPNEDKQLRHPFSAPDAKACHRDRLLSMQLEHTRLCSQHRCKLLGEFGIRTAGDLLACDVKTLQPTQTQPKATRLVRRYRGAIRLAAAVPGMMPRDAQLLIGIHRRSVRGLACETPAAVHRDLVRFSVSTKGRRLIRGRRLPSVRRIRKWIDACETTVARTQRVPRAGDAGSIIFAKAA